MPKIDPFALATETTGRFRMLVALAFVVAWSLGAQMVEVPTDLGLGLGTQIDPELDVLGSRTNQVGFAGLSREEVRRFSDLFQERGAVAAFGSQVSRFFFSILMILALLGGAAVIGHVLRRRQHQKHPVLEASAAPRVTGEIRELFRSVTSRKLLALRFKPGFLDGLIFGKKGGEVLVVAGLPQQLERSWSDLHRAVVLHEIGHWVNGDVRWREWVRCLLFVLTVQSGLILSCAPWVHDLKPTTYLAGMAESAAVLAIAWILWAGLIRAREIEADWRVVSWGQGQALRRRLSLISALPPTARHEGAGGSSKKAWLFFRRCKAWRLWSFHPSNHRRLEALQHPDHMFSVGIGLTFIIGLSTALIASQLTPAASDFQLLIGVVGAAFLRSSHLLESLFLVTWGVMTLLFLVATYLVTGVVGIQTLRAALASLSSPGSFRPALLRPAALFAAGLELGFWIFLGIPPQSVLDLLSSGAWVAGVTLLFWIWLRYIAICGREILGSWQGRSAPSVGVRILQGLFALVLSLALCPAVVVRESLSADIPSLFWLTGSLRPPTEQYVDTARLMLMYWVFSTGLAVFVGLTGLILGWIVVQLRRKPCQICGHIFGAGPAVGRACETCGTDLAAWSVFRPAKIRQIEDRRHRRGDENQTGKKFLALAVGLLALAWFPLGLLSVAAPFLPGFEETDTERNDRQWYGDDPTGIFWLTTFVTLILPSVLSGVSAILFWQRIRRREIAARKDWIEDDESSAGLLRDWLSQLTAKEENCTQAIVGSRFAASGLMLQLSTHYRRLLDHALRGEGISDLMITGRRRNLAVRAVLWSSTLSLLVLALVFCLLAIFVAFSGFVYEADQTALEVRWVRATVGGLYVGWPSLVWLSGAIVLLRIDHDRQQWRGRTASLLLQRFLEIRQHARECLEQLATSTQSHERQIELLSSLAGGVESGGVTRQLHHDRLSTAGDVRLT